ncbi:uncharacterized protein LOC118409579 [Branchiostoma floridae]|uniref:Uncharacterized protein LOC118409579 n=1 Tax=Branchiostoma floridae TaxID=7739 RepID=A0A9J7MFW0_BRAFL|nr:uncharacterized protein LOC118409579 [Branchiostoma floridae]
MTCSRTMTRRETFHGDGGPGVNRRRQTPERKDGERQREMASLGKLLSRALSFPAQLLPASRALSFPAQLLPATRRLHMPADGPGWEFIQGLGRMAGQLPTVDPPTPARNICTDREGLSVNAVIIKAALDNIEALDVTDEPPASSLLLMEHAEVFGASAPATWGLKSQPSRQLPTSWTFRGGRLPVKSA